MRMPVRTALLLALCLPSGGTLAQSIGGAVPPYQPVPPVPPPQRSDNVTVPVAKDNPFKSREDLTRAFASSYQRSGRPRLALYWNRQLTDTLDEWYGTTRIVVSNQHDAQMSGNVNSPALSGSADLNVSGSSQTTIEAQRRVRDPNSSRLQPSEAWEWQFQDGFLAPFLAAGAIVVDRATIVRIAGAEAKGSTAPTIEAKALQGLADFLMEILVSPQSQSTLGYELRARVIEVKTGRIVAYVNSRALKEWNPAKEAVATNRGFELPGDDDDTFGPVRTNAPYEATSQGFVRSQKPPKLPEISQNLAYNVMSALMTQWR